MENMLDLAHRENIIVEEFYLEPPLKGIYICQYNPSPLSAIACHGNFFNYTHLNHCTW